ncbi:UPF0160 protein MYG1, mitochondrial [Acrasis kona]|uniref:UPF0160 protein MYG1, mitochondrial n=1 Tax=Acrasis kona TaxID=1008807 RepID=A0AAW2ZR66_9EUKA
MRSTFKILTNPSLNFHTIRKMSSIKIFEVYPDIPQDLKGAKVIGTHNGLFHCDESLAVAMLSLTNEFNNSVVVRTRDEKILEKCDAVVDVGAVYDPSRHRYDHHQNSFQDALDETQKTRLSSSGLIYKHFGRQIIAKLLKESNMDNLWLDKLYDRVYTNFMEHIDAIDNGISVADGELKYKITTTLSNRVGRLNPSWTVKSTKELENESFKKAVKLTGEEFEDVIKGYIKEWVPARAIVQEAYDSHRLLDGRAIQFSEFCPWKEHLFDIEEENKNEGHILYALFPDNTGACRVQAVPVKGGDFENRKPLPKPWRGLRDQELSEKTGIEGCVFVHASGFIGGARTLEVALKMAKAAVAFEEEDEQEKKRPKLE